MSSPRYIVFADGASKGNPGPSSIGGVCFADKIPDLSEFKTGSDFIFKVSEKIGIKTNNEAEYNSVIAVLENLRKNNINSADIYMDSELVIKQINGNYKVKKDTLIPLWKKVQELKSDRDYRFAHVPREKNQIADFLANLALK